jgi:hypothetical protein
MIIAGFNGGLGNQLFQYAAGKALANGLGVELKLDISFFDNNPDRVYELDIFNISTKVVLKKDLNRFSPENPSLILRFGSRLSESLRR